MAVKQGDALRPADSATGGDTLGTGGPHTHPLSAPHELTPESGTPAFSKGRHVPAQNPAESDPTGEARRPWRGAEAPTRREAAVPD